MKLLRAAVSAALAFGPALPALAAAEGPKSGMPQLDPHAFAPQLVWLAITFIVLYVLMSRVALPRVSRVLEDRENRIAADLAAAERLKAESEAAIAAYQASLAKARGDAQAAIGAVRERAAATASAESRKVDQALGQKIKEAEAAIAAAKQSAKVGLKTVAVDATRDVVRRIIGVEVSPSAAEAAVNAIEKGGR
ncbi:MAG TPA: hypothetical protein VEU47_10385 [Candidatus Cybelea sp.]|nr:hypothetical protein [Candidatus Cybelea sp.]